MGFGRFCLREVEREKIKGSLKRSVYFLSVVNFFSKRRENATHNHPDSPTAQEKVCLS
jgi:hypothetical protein